MNDNTGNDMSHYPLFTAACMFSLFLFNKVIGLLYQFEPMTKMLTTYGTFLVFIIVTTVQLVRWYRRYRRPRSRRSEN